MIQAVLRLFAITALSLILTFFAVLGVRQVGLLQKFASPPHVWFENPVWRVYAPGSEQLCAPDLKLDKTWIVALPIHFKESEWRIKCPQDLALKTWLETHAHGEILLQIEATDTTHLDNLVESVGYFDAKKRFGVFSPSQRVARYMRKKAPQWLYAADSASLLRLRVFESLWVETAMDFWPDFVFASARGDMRLRPRAAYELARRQKRILWQVDESADTPDIPIHGIMTTRSTDLERFKLPK